MMVQKLVINYIISMIHQMLSCTCSVCSGSVLEEDHYSLIRGMQGYEVTPADLVFLKRARQERQINALQVKSIELMVKTPT
jgi:hypothetical protein